MLRKVFGILARVLCYPSLVIVVAAFVAIEVLHGGACPRIDTGAVFCNDPVSQEWANFALSVALLSFFTGVPLLLALGGLWFLIRDGWRLIRRART